MSVTASGSALPSPITTNLLIGYQEDCPNDAIAMHLGQMPRPELDAEAKRLINSAVQARGLAEARHAKTQGIPSKGSLVERIDATEAALRDPNLPVILNGAFYAHDPQDKTDMGVMVSIDQLVRGAGNVFNVVEVKADNSIMLPNSYVSTKTGEVDPTPKYDPKALLPLAVQMRVLQQNRLPIASAGFLVVNPDYRHPGGYDYDANALFTYVDALPGLTAEIYAQADALLTEVAKHLKAGKADGLEHKRSCKTGKKALGPTHIDRMMLNKDVRARLDGMGITDLKNIPDNFNDGAKEKEKLNENQLRIIAALKTGKTAFDRDKLMAGIAKIQALLDSQGGVISFLDYETIQFAIPMMKGTRCNDYVTLQFSNHKAKTLADVLNQGDETLQHDQYVYEGDVDGDWAKEAAVRILDSVGQAGPIVVWNETFEIGRTTELAEIMAERGETKLANELYALIGGNKAERLRGVAQAARAAGHEDAARKIEAIISLDSGAIENLAKFLRKDKALASFADELDAIRQDKGRIVDLLDIVRDSVYHPDFDFSFSIKSVVKALTGHGYDELDDEVNMGLEASDALARRLKRDTSEAEKRILLGKLYEYCGRDTIAEVWILRECLKLGYFFQNSKITLEAHVRF